MAEVVYNGSGDIVWKGNPDGSQDVYNIGDLSWVLSSTGNVFIMACGVGFYYSGLLRRKNALSALYASLVSVAVVILVWFIWGFSLAFSDSAGVFIGNLKYAAFTNIYLQPATESTKIPMSLYALYEMMFAATTAVIAVGALAERGRLGPLPIFIFLWVTIVYCPVACWTWNTHGWGRKLGVLDFAGGIAVHIVAGATSLAMSLYLGPRLQSTANEPWQMHNISGVILGTVLMWYGWFGFNGGSSLSANLLAVQALINTNLAAAAGGLAWVLMDYRMHEAWGSVSFCAGVISGLVTITPGSGYVSAPAAVLFGFLGGIICNLSTYLKRYGRYDDSLDIFATHAIGGLLGSLLTGIFAQSNIYSRAGTGATAKLGWLDGNWKQVPIQLAASTAALVWAFAWTYSILKLMSRLSFTKMRASREAQETGLDEHQMHEAAFNVSDYPTILEVNKHVVSTVQNMRNAPGRVRTIDDLNMAQNAQRPPVGAAGP
ncbi:ammonium transporter AmtB-like domain-containing protein [Crepidotus variabilis]|uniref:Ammonium transporter n=1 Tax=Crepidotus variabilis TaxID=179855 RepID=A0A9P6E8L9_9AGAR|nr:ammonium transporter AmtB-like domain-containing protein [Crepidotus variabilis]